MDSGIKRVSQMWIGELSCFGIVVENEKDSEICYSIRKM